MTKMKMMINDIIIILQVNISLNIINAFLFISNKIIIVIIICLIKLFT
jgi:hypothetical protein